MPPRPLKAELFSAASIRKSRPEIKNHCSKEVINRQNPAAIPKSSPEIKNRCTKEGVNGENLASIPKSGPEIKNHCTQKVVFGEILTSIRKSGLEIKNRCTHESVNGKNLASIRKSGPEIKNRCTNQPIFSTHPQHIPPARVHHALTTRLALDILHGHGLDSGSTVAVKAGADAPGGGISLCFCHRGCAAPAQKAATLNTPPPQNQPKPRNHPKPQRNRRHAQRPRHPRDNPTLQQKSPAEKDQPDY